MEDAESTAFAEVSMPERFRRDRAMCLLALSVAVIACHDDELKPGQYDMVSMGGHSLPFSCGPGQCGGSSASYTVTGSLIRIPDASHYTFEFGTSRGVTYDTGTWSQQGASVTFSGSPFFNTNPGIVDGGKLAFTDSYSKLTMVYERR